MAADHAANGQLIAAADFVSQVFRANNIPFALMGGFALKLRGSNRDTHDVDVAVGCTMQRLIEVLSAQSRVRRPAGPTSGVMKVFVRVGGQLNPGVSELWVAVDMILRGSLGAPDNPQNSSEVLTFSTAAGPKQLPVIDILSAMGSKLNAYYARQGQSDYQDISFLITKYPEQIFALRTQLNATHRQYFVASFAQGNPQNAVRRVKHVLGVA
ncbi:hypothetical protein K458DRAFT_353109 [Lentithecium fluviatile CBS 122367]|uniref:Nucleotidyl transferase AbiEii/AbiGii toxin family protein n=1 Tax=Lentithecium fluviatile CBS 122367 TaxID=1168545 RepID=A0A6G1JLD9_9PLEO|nr:hypothetical protein K458DRAFT_353109 [Lentithecium fluviatile CBS 122367]